MSERLTVHTWGFVNEAGDWIAGDGAAVSAESVRGVWDRLTRHHRHFGLEPERIRRTFNSFLAGVEFEVPDDGTAARMWHRIHPECDSWPDFNDTPPKPQPTADDQTEAECQPNREASR